MTECSDPEAERVRIVEQQVHDAEVVDGIFGVNQARAIAITSERIMIVSGDARSWALAGIPWRLVTSVELKPNGPGSRCAIEVTYTVHTERLTRQGEATAIDRTALFSPERPEAAVEIIRLMNARKSCV